MVKVRGGKSYVFYLDGKRIYVRVVGSLNQQFLVETVTMEKMSDHDYIQLIDAIYRRKIRDTVTLNEHLYSKFRLVTTSKKLA